MKQTIIKVFSDILQRPSVAVAVNMTSSEKEETDSNTKVKLSIMILDNSKDNQTKLIDLQ